MDVSKRHRDILKVASLFNVLFAVFFFSTLRRNNFPLVMFAASCYGAF